MTIVSSCFFLQELCSHEQRINAMLKQGVATNRQIKNPCFGIEWGALPGASQ
jgi:hypothetical protein